MTREEARDILEWGRPYDDDDREKLNEFGKALEVAIKTLGDFEALNAINLDLTSENEDLVERIGKLVGYIDFLRNTAQGKKKSLNLLEKVVKGQIKEIRAEGENFVKPKTGEWIPVTERLPEEGQMVIACYPTDCGKRIMTAYYYKECGFSCGITYAWMPLPKPYKGGQEDGKA